MQESKPTENHLKQNLCHPQFPCTGFLNLHGGTYLDCIYFVPDPENPEYCKYDRHRAGICESAVANVNCMVLLLKKIGIAV